MAAGTDPADPFGTAAIRLAVTDAWSASPARFREDANAEEDLVLGGYRDRVLVELAQNAADAAMRAGTHGRVRFVLDGDVLRVANTGTALDAAGVQSLATLRASSKRADGRAVGKFGVGFAAVVAVSDAPRIVSRTGAVEWSRERTLATAHEIPALADELRHRGDAAPVLRLPFAVDGGLAASDEFDTEVVLPLRDPAAGTLVRELLAGIDAALLLMLPALESVEIVTDAASRTLRAQPWKHGVVVDGIRWHLHSGRRTIDADVLRDRPVEERAQREFSLTWAVPVGANGEPMSLPTSVAAVVHAPTPTDEPLTLPALLIAPLPLDPTRRHVAAGPLCDLMLDTAAGEYVELVRDLPATVDVLGLVPVGVAAGAIDGVLRAVIVERLRRTAFLVAADGDTRLRPDDAVMLAESDLARNANVINVLGDAVPAMVAADWAGAYRGALSTLGVRTLALTDVLDELAALDRPPVWWHQLYAAFAEADVARDQLAGLPVPLASGALARSPRGLLMPGHAEALSLLGFRVIEPEAAHPLLLRLGALEVDPRAVLADARTRAAVENSFEAEDPDAVAEVVLGLVAAAGTRVDDLPWLADLALRSADGEVRAAGELLLPEGKLATLVVDDSPFGVVEPALLRRWGVATLTAVGVLDDFAVVRDSDVLRPDHDLDGEDDYLAAVTAGADSDEPAVLAELVGVRDLEFVREAAWPQALALLAGPMLRSAVVEPAFVVTSNSRVRVPSYTAWWLRAHGVVRGRLAASDPVLAGLYDVVDVGLDDEFLVAAGALRDIADADPDDLLRRLAEPGRMVTRAQVRQIYARVEPDELPDFVRGLRGGVLETVAAQDAVIVDAPDLLPLLGNFAIVPCALTDAVRVADALDVALASELGDFALCSAGEIRDDHVLHETLMVADVDGVPRHVGWRWLDGVLHVDSRSLAFGLGRGRAWRAGAWGRRHIETELLRDSADTELLLAEADLDED